MGSADSTASSSYCNIPSRNIKFKACIDLGSGLVRSIFTNVQNFSEIWSSDIETHIPNTVWSYICCILFGIQLFRFINLTYKTIFPHIK